MGLAIIIAIHRHRTPWTWTRSGCSGGSDGPHSAGHAAHDAGHGHGPTPGTATRPAAWPSGLDRTRSGRGGLGRPLAVAAAIFRCSPTPAPTATAVHGPAPAAPRVHGAGPLRRRHPGPGEARGAVVLACLTVLTSFGAALSDRPPPDGAVAGTETALRFSQPYLGFETGSRRGASSVPVRPPHRQPVGGDDAGGDGRGLPDPHLLAGLHGPRPGAGPLLLVPEPVHVLHAACWSWAATCP